MRIDEVREQLRGYGAREPHVLHLLRQWLETRPLGSGGRKPADFLPLRLREALPALQRSLDDIARVSSSHPARDGSTRLLMALADGQSRPCCCRVKAYASRRRWAARWVACSA
jgi:23S rRNA (adenine2503-C2)-methyltransferase